MSVYSIVISGSEAESDDLKELFENLVRGARLISAEDSVDGSLVTSDAPDIFAHDVEDLDDDDDLGDDPSDDAGPAEDDPTVQEMPVTEIKED